MLNNFAYQLTLDDLPRMLEIYKTRNSNVKVKINSTLDRYFHKVFEVACSGQLGHSAWGYKNEEGKLVMFATRSHWSGMPYSTVGNFFVDADNSITPNLGISNKTGSLITNKFFTDIFYDSAINHQRYVSFMVRAYREVVITVKTIKKSNTLEDRNLIFKMGFVELIPPYNRAKFEFGSNILGILEGRNPEPVIIRSWTLEPNNIPALTNLKNYEFVIN